MTAGSGTDATRVLRWCAVVPVALSAVWVGFVLGANLERAAVQFCPARYRFEASTVLCFWPESIRQVFVAVTYGLAAVLGVAAGTVTAPDRRLQVGTVLWLGGSVAAAVACWLLRVPTGYGLGILAATAAGGAVGVFLVTRARSQALQNRRGLQ